MFSRTSQFRTVLLLLLFVTVPYCCDLISGSDVLGGTLAEQTSLLELDANDDETSSSTFLETLFVTSLHIEAEVHFAIAASHSTPFDSEVILAVSGCRPPPFSV